MRHIYYLLLAGCVGVGCVWFPMNEKKEPPKPAPTKAERKPSQVTPDQVKETTAHSVATQLDAEVSIDETTPIDKPAPDKPKK